MKNKKMICENGHTFKYNEMEKIWNIGERIYYCPICKSKSIAYEESGHFDLKRKIKIKLSPKEREMLHSCNWDSEGMLRLIKQSEEPIIELNEISANQILTAFFISPEGSSIQKKIYVQMQNN